MTDGIPKPFLKWAGGKGQILDRVEHTMPVRFTRYFEPFLGGGAVFFHLYRQGFRGPALLSDLNEELIAAYETVRKSVKELIDELQSGTYQTDKDTFYKIRAWDREAAWATADRVRRTARLIYLNRTCYNGLYRVNRAGYFNVPYGGYVNPTICDEENLHAVSRSLQKVKLQHADFMEAVRNAGEGDFVYLDPPYQPLSTTSSFTDYTVGGFGQEEQQRLADVFCELHARGCLVLESNSSHEFILRLYSDTKFTIESVKAKRAISCVGDGRGEIDELFIRNYEETRQQRLV